MPYTAIDFTAFQTLTAAQMDTLAANDASFNDGTGLGDNTITQEKLKATVAFAAYSSASITASATPAKIQLATEEFDEGADFDNATNYRS